MYIGRLMDVCPVLIPKGHLLATLVNECDTTEIPGRISTDEIDLSNR